MQPVDRISCGFVCEPTAAEVAALEALPIDSLWVGGHVASTNPTLEAMMQLGRLAGVSQRVRIGTSILLLPLYPPGLVAKQIADLDNATGGRVILGVGVGGEQPGDFAACEVPIGERGARADEAIPLLRQFWTAEPVTHAGRHYAFDGVRIHPAPSRHGGPPIVVSGRQRPAMRRAAVLGDGWMPYLYSARRYAESVDVIRSIAADADRDLDGFEWAVFVCVSVDRDQSRARATAIRFLGGAYGQDFESMLDRVAVVGAPETVTAKLQEYVDAGARHLVVVAADRANTPAVAELFMSDVMPSLA